MTERVAVFVRVEDSDGARGWGEIWSQLPNGRAEHRALLFADIVAPRALGKSLDDPAALWAEIDARCTCCASRAAMPAPLGRRAASIWRSMTCGPASAACRCGGRWAARDDRPVPV